MANILPDLIRIRFTYMLLLLGLSAFAQELPDTTQVLKPLRELPVDSLVVAGEAVPDTTSQADSASSTVLEAPITYNATDSIVISLDGKKVYLYKDAVVTYQTIELKADYIELDLQTKEVYAEGVPDSADVMQGEPVFKDGQEEFESETLRYNFETQKGIITEVKTQQGEGYVHSERTKKIDANAFILKKGKYTTCDADHPHFYLRMTKAKVISNKKIITGPAYLVLEDFPIYFPMIPFGFFPNSPTYSSGIIIPTYGEEQNRGFFLREGGYYWAASQYFDLTVKGDIYSKGSWGSNLHTNYKKRYKFSGSFDFRYNVNRYSDPGLPDFSRSPGFSLQWSHSQDSKANPFQTFSANVNLSTTSYDKQNSYNVQNYLQTTKSSSISYSKKWENSPFNMSSSFRHSQNSRDSTISLSFPELTFSMSKIYPFKQKGRVGPAKWYEKIGFSYTGNIKNSITAREDEILNKSLITDWSNGWKHSIPISLPNFNLFKYINVSPSISYSERWYTNYLEKNYAFDHVAQEGTLWVDTIYHFKRNYNYSFALSSQTNIYGMYQIKNPNSRVKAIRHKISPSISLSYNPDFTDPKYGFWDSYIDENGNVISYNRFANGIFGSASSKESGSINFGLTNNLEAKVAAKNDTTATEEKFQKVKIIDNLGFSGSYNLIADSLNLSNIRINGRTTIKGVNLNFGGTLDPYATDTKGNKINKYMWNEASGLAKLGRLTNANLSFGMSFKSKKEDEKKEGEESTVEEVVYPDGRVEYYDFSMPWDFRFDYSLSYSKRSPYHDAQINQSLNFSGRLNLTREWNMQLTTNFDVQAGEFSFTTFNINRKLHCWNMSFNFVPFGQRKSYSFTINASSSMLKDLKVNKQRSWFDNN
ncbi:putative LPS assembly protein LptD [uncultured Sunxiuqinia sp.]|uniref:putative LPS assembly protein LptD n=1 Tax=uncultured Sunxiuqinia sp. TaxID=1573825 RepID=UPI002602D9D0|nr:putative LPS assembly protein LptD [uncultured Sunxiuqinia sp.]